MYHATSGSPSAAILRAPKPGRAEQLSSLAARAPNSNSDPKLDPWYADASMASPLRASFHVLVTALVFVHLVACKSPPQPALLPTTVDATKSDADAGLSGVAPPSERGATALPAATSSCYPDTDLSGNPIPIIEFTQDELDAARKYQGTARVRLLEPVIVTGQFDLDTVRRYFALQKAKLDLCYAAGLKTDRALTGDVTIEFVIDQQGAVTIASATVNSMCRSKVPACLGKVFHGARLPKPKAGIAKVSYPLKLQL
jgi:hypothetical protein